MTFEKWWAANGSEFDPRVKPVFADLWRKAVAAERGRWRALAADLWRYATGDDLGEMTEEDAAAEGETLLGLFRRIREGGAE